MNKYRFFAIIALVCFCISGITGYTVTNNKLYDPTGKQVLIRGVDRPSFEWSQTGEQASLADYTLMKVWGANCVRIALNQDFWLQTSTYATTIDQQVAWVTGLGMGVILDLHWNQGAQQNMADRNSITFWSQVAARYKNNAWVMFELYNEPHDVSWSQWRNGDSTYAGMQEMYNAVRAAGASNTVLAGGLNWAFDLSGVSNGYALTGTNIAYATHPYDYPGKQIADWPAAFGNLAATYPVVMTEFGQYCNSDTYVHDLLVYAQSNGIHWTAWAWYVGGCSFPSIIADWAGTPTDVGLLVKSYLTGGSNSGSSSSGSSSSGSGSSSAPTAAPTSAPTQAGSSMSVYSGSLTNGWQDWSWSTSYSLSDTTYVYGSSGHSIRFEVKAYEGIYLHSSAFAIGSYTTVQFYVNGGTNAVSSSALSVKVYGTTGSVIGNSVNFPASVPASQWSLISIPISSFGVPASTQIVGFVIQSNVVPSAGNIYIANIAFVPASSGNPTNAPTSAPTAAPTTRPTQAPTAAPTAAPTTRPTQAPTAAPTTRPTSAPTSAPTTRPTTAPTTAPTSAPTTRPTTAPTSAPTTRPTTAPTSAPTTRPTTAPTSAPTVHPTTAPTSKPSTTGSTSGTLSSCDASSVHLTQSQLGAWSSNGQAVTQYTLTISSTCTSKTLVGLTLQASNWNAVSFWNVLVSSANGHTVLTLPSYFSVTPSTSYSIGYQNVGGEAAFTVSSAIFQ